MRRGAYRTRAAVAGAFFLALVAGLQGCVSGERVVVADISPGGWDERVELMCSNLDTVSLQAATFVLRHDQRARSGGYAVEFRTPSGRIVLTDTVSMELPDRVSFSIPPRPRRVASMTWRRFGLGTVRLTEQGDYVVAVTPLRPALGVWSVGIELDSPGRETHRREGHSSRKISVNL